MVSRAKEKGAKMDKRNHVANVNGIVVRGGYDKIINFAKAKGYEAEESKDYRLAHTYFQCAENWIRTKNNERKV